MKFSTRNQYILYISALYLVLIFLVYRLLFEDKILFIASEVFLFISLLVAVRLYQNFVQPNEFVKSGIEAIKDKDFTIKFVPTGKGEIDTLIEVYNLMIDQLREERTKHRAQHFFLEKLIDASPTAIVILDFDERIASANTRAITLLGVDLKVMKGQKLDETKLSLMVELGKMQNGESKILKADGVQKFKVQRSHFMDQGFRRSFLMIEEMTSELLEQEKNAYGKVIRMMAHEVNNTLGATDSILQTTHKSLPAAEFAELREALHVASERNRRLTIFMRNFAEVVRLPTPNLQTTDLGNLIGDIVVLMQPLAAQKGVSMAIAKSTFVSIEVDSGQMEQVLVNIIKNAIEACEPGNRVELQLTNGHLVVRNDGKPISPQEADQLFNPFYSSKPDGQGIGLTLSREILLNHDFAFSLKTNEDGWTEFVILLKKSRTPA